MRSEQEIRRAIQHLWDALGPAEDMGDQLSKTASLALIDTLHWVLGEKSRLAGALAECEQGYRDRARHEQN